VRALALEIEKAIEAIKSNNLRQLQESIGRQESLCWLLSPPTVQGRPSFGNLNGSARAELGREINALNATARTYNILVRQCAKTNALLQTLCRSYAGAYRSTHSPSARGRALSCEA